MKFSDAIIMPAPQHAVWSLLTNPTAMQECIPGLTELVEETPGERYRGVLAFRLGKTQRTRLPVVVLWESLFPPETGRLRARTALGETVIDVVSAMALAPDEARPETTLLTWEAEISLPNASDRTRQMMTPMLTSLTNRWVTEFFARVARTCATTGTTTP